MAKSATKTTEAILEVAALLADKLELTIEEGEPSFKEGQQVLIASKNGIEVGVIKQHSGETNIYRFTESIMNGITILMETQRRHGVGWAEKVSRNSFYPEGSIIYTEQ